MLSNRGGNRLEVLKQPDCVQQAKFSTELEIYLVNHFRESIKLDLNLLLLWKRFFEMHKEWALVSSNLCLHKRFYFDPLKSVLKAYCFSKIGLSTNIRKKQIFLYENISFWLVQMFLMLLLSKTPVMVHFEGGKKGPNALGVLELMDQRGKLNLFLGQTISLLLSVVLLNPLLSS